MSNILVVKSSASGDASISNRLTNQLVARLHGARQDLKVVERDLDHEPIPHLRSHTLAGIGGPVAVSEGAIAARELSDALIRELREADLLVIGAPMYNFGISSTLKSWFDHVLRAGETFRYGPTGPEGLMPPKPVIVIETRGGLYSEGPGSALDSQEPHLRTMLGFIGLSDVEFVRVEKLASAAAEEAIAAAIDRLSGLRLDQWAVAA